MKARTPCPAISEHLAKLVRTNIPRGRNLEGVEPCDADRKREGMQCKFKWDEEKKTCRSKPDATTCLYFQLKQPILLHQDEKLRENTPQSIRLIIHITKSLLTTASSQRLRKVIQQFISSFPCANTWWEVITHHRLIFRTNSYLWMRTFTESYSWLG